MVGLRVAFPKLGESEVKMGNKVKIFRADKIDDLEFHINRFLSNDNNSYLSNDNIELIDLKFVSNAGYVVLLVYRER